MCLTHIPQGYTKLAWSTHNYTSLYSSRGNPGRNPSRPTTRTRQAQLRIAFSGLITMISLHKRLSNAHIKTKHISNRGSKSQNEHISKAEQNHTIPTQRDPGPLLESPGLHLKSQTLQMKYQISTVPRAPKVGTLSQEELKLL